MKTIIDIYKCVILTVIAVLLFVMFLRIPAPLTMDKVRAGNVTGWETKVPLVGIIDVSPEQSQDP